MSSHADSEDSLGTGDGSAAPSRLYGSTATDRAKTVAATSRVAQSTSAFSSWARDVLLMPPSDEEPLPLPDALKALQDASKLVPLWIFNPFANPPFI
ncbi:hypothetical protein FRC08_016243 [Ceratobasidium sp. 394]|nr:hypothetical protein FRC08_016243 [Ceratobasidium sp. 394]